MGHQWSDQAQQRSDQNGYSHYFFTTPSLGNPSTTDLCEDVAIEEGWEYDSFKWLVIFELFLHNDDCHRQVHSEHIDVHEAQKWQESNHITTWRLPAEPKTILLPMFRLRIASTKVTN